MKSKRTRSRIAAASMRAACSLVAAAQPTLPDALQGVTRIAFFGDSLTDGSDYPEYVVNTLNKTYPGHDFCFVNAGVCGSKAYDLVDRLDRDVLSRKPDLTFILIGTNDSGTNPLIQFRAELAYLCRRLKAAGSRVGLISLTGSTNPEMVKKFTPYNDAIRATAREEGALFVDAWSLFDEWQKSGKEMYYSPGDAHHSALGFQGTARAILNALGVPPDVELVLDIAPPPNLLAKWEESGPVTGTASNPPEPAMVREWTPYEPEKWIESKDWSWKPLVRRGAWFALQGAAKGRTAFARATYDAPRDGLYELQLGGGVPLAVWVNGVKVYTLPKTNGYHPDAVRTPVLLRKGPNEIAITTGFYAFVGVRPLD